MQGGVQCSRLEKPDVLHIHHRHQAWQACKMRLKWMSCCSAPAGASWRAWTAIWEAAGEDDLPTLATPPTGPLQKMHAFAYGRSVSHKIFHINMQTFVEIFNAVFKLQIMGVFKSWSR